MNVNRDNDGDVTMVVHTLNFINTTDSDSGTYICMSSNDANPGSDMEDFQLIVQSE